VAGKSEEMNDRAASRKPLSRRNLEDLTDAEIYAAIRYLDPDAQSAGERNDSGDVVLGIIFVLALACVALVCFYELVG
jgi:hypothetical protein